VTIQMKNENTSSHQAIRPFQANGPDVKKMHKLPPATTKTAPQAQVGAPARHQRFAALILEDGDGHDRHLRDGGADDSDVAQPGDVVQCQQELSAAPRAICRGLPQHLRKNELQQKAVAGNGPTGCEL